MVIFQGPVISEVEEAGAAMRRRKERTLGKWVSGKRSGVDDMKEITLANSQTVFCAPFMSRPWLRESKDKLKVLVSKRKMDLEASRCRQPE